MSACCNNNFRCSSGFSFPITGDNDDKTLLFIWYQSGYFNKSGTAPESRTQNRAASVMHHVLEFAADLDNRL